MRDSIHFLLLTLPLEKERWFKLISEKMRNGIVRRGFEGDSVVQAQSGPLRNDSLQRLQRLQNLGMRTGVGSRA